MKRTSVVNSSDDTNNCDIKGQESTGGVGIIHRRLQQFEKKNMTIKPPIKPKPTTDTLYQSSLYRQQSIEKVRSELRRKLELEMQMLPNDRPNSVTKTIYLKKTLTIPQTSFLDTSEKKVIENVNIIKNDSFLAALAAKIVMRNDSFTSHSEESSEWSQSLCNSGRNSAHKIMTSVNNKPVEAISFLYKNREQDNDSQTKTSRLLVRKHEPKDEAEYEIMHENNKNSIHNLQSRLSPSKIDTGSFLYRNSVSGDGKYHKDLYKSPHREVPELEAEYDVILENDKKSAHVLITADNFVSSVDAASFLYKNCQKNKDNQTRTSQTLVHEHEPKKEAEYEILPEHNKNSTPHLPNRLSASQIEDGSLLYSNSISQDEKYSKGLCENPKREVLDEEAEYDVILQNYMMNSPCIIRSTYSNPVDSVTSLSKNSEKFIEKREKLNNNLTLAEEEYSCISEYENYTIDTQRNNAHTHPFDFNNNGDSRNNFDTRFVNNSSPIYNEIESDEENLYETIGCHKPCIQKTTQDNSSLENLADSNTVGAVNEFCKHANTDSARNTLGSPEKYKRKLRDLTKELIDTEEKYVNCLTHVVTDYISELDRKDIPENLVAEKQSIFSNIDLLYRFHSYELLPSFREAKYDFASLGKAFTDNEENFKLYIKYYINKSKLCDLNPVYKDFFMRRQMEIGEKHSLSTFLLEPIQRMPRYEMLLGQLVNTYKKYNDEVSKDVAYIRESSVNWDGSEPELVLACLTDAYSMIKKILKTVNDGIALENIENCQIDLQMQGDLILQNEFIVYDSSKRRLHLRCFLFENVLLLSTISRVQPKKEVYTFYDAIFMTDLGLTPPEGDKSERFTVWLQKRTRNPYIIEARGETLSCWVRGISELLWKQAERDKERLMSFRKIKPVKVIESTTAPCDMPVYLNTEPRKLPETNAPKDKCMSKGRKKRKQEVNSTVKDTFSFVGTSLCRVPGEVGERKKKARRTTWYTEN